MCLFKILSLKKQPSKYDTEKALLSRANISKRLREANSQKQINKVIKSDLF